MSLINTFDEKKRTITITFGDRAKNHKGMKMIGNKKRNLH